MRRRTKILFLILVISCLTSIYRNYALYRLSYIRSIKVNSDEKLAVAIYTAIDFTEITLRASKTRSLYSGTVPIDIAVGNTGDPDVLGTASSSMLGCEIVISDKLTDVVQVLWVVNHELGHCFGLDHDGQETSVMSEYYFEPTDKDVNYFIKQLKNQINWF